MAGSTVVAGMTVFHGHFCSWRENQTQITDSRHACRDSETISAAQPFRMLTSHRCASDSHSLVLNSGLALGSQPMVPAPSCDSQPSDGRIIPAVRAVLLRARLGVLRLEWVDGQNPVLTKHHTLIQAGLMHKMLSRI